MTFPGVTLTPDWGVLLFVAGLLLIVIISPSVEQIKTKEIEINVHTASPIDPFPSPAKWESQIGAMAKEKEKLLDLHRSDSLFVMEPITVG
jgi:hypothetical protein